MVIYLVWLHMYHLWALIDSECQGLANKGQIPSNQTIIAYDTFNFLMITYSQWTKTLIKANQLRVLQIVSKSNF